MTPEERKQILIDYLETGTLKICPSCKGVGCDKCDRGVLDFLDVLRGGKAIKKKSKVDFPWMRSKVFKADDLTNLKKVMVRGKPHVKYNGNLVPLDNMPAFLKSKVKD